MSARPFTTVASHSVGSWIPAAAGTGPVAASVRHVVDLGQFLADGAHNWPDAMTSETRRHIAGCLASIETGLIAAIRSTPVGRLVAALETPIVWPMVRRHPLLLSPELLVHMRLRAAVSLLGGQATRTQSDPAAGTAPGTAWLLDAEDPAIFETASALALAEGRWITTSAEGVAMLPDVPAEHYAEMVWTGVATLATAVYRAGLAEKDAALRALTDAAHTLLSAHDEAQGAVALATRLTRLLKQDQLGQLLGQALAERRYLLFAAIASELMGIAPEALLDVLVHGEDTHLAALCHSLGGSAADYRHLLIDLRVVRGERDDPTLVRLAQAYDALSTADIAEQAETLRRPAPLRAKLDLIAASVAS